MAQAEDAKQGFNQVLAPATLAAARRGRSEAFAEIYRLYSRACYTLALRISGHTTAAEDIVHDVFIKLMRRIGAYRSDAPFGAWFKRIVVNEAIDWLRARKPLLSESELDDTGHTLAVQEPAEGLPGAVEHDLHGLLMALSPQARSILVLHDIEGYTHGEIAAMFGMTESFSKSVLSRSRRKLQTSLIDGEATPTTKEACNASLTAH